MTHYSLLRLKHFPEVDFNAGQNGILVGPAGDINFKRDKLTTKDPIIDLNEKTPKINFATPEEVKILYHVIKKDFIKSFLIHGSLLLLFIILNYLSLFKQSDPQIVEVTFGLSDQLTRAKPEEEIKQPEGQTEATKTVQDLPQLPKNVSPDMGPKPSVDNENTNINKNNDLVFNEKSKVKPPENKQKQDITPKQVGPKVDTTKRNVEEKDYLKRKEEDLRKIAEQKKQGVHGKDMTKPEGQKHVSSALPPSPFQNSLNLPEAPPGLAPAGDESGTNVANYNAYRSYLTKQLRLNWQTNEGTAFPKSLKAVVEFTVNPFGYLLGKPRIVTSSGNKDFDNLALEAVQGTFPVSTPPPKSIHPPQTFKAAYSGKEIN